VLSVSTTTTLGILCGSAIGSVVPSGDAASSIVASATLAVLVGVILLVARLVRLGFVANFISDPVLIGFKAGVGLVIVVDQAPKLFGIHFPKTDWLHSVAALITHLPGTSLATLAVGLGTVLVLLALEHFAPRLPSPLLVVAGGIAAAYFLDLKSAGVAIVGHISGGLPGLIPPKLALVKTLWAPALAIALMSFTETVAAGRAFTDRGESRPRHLANGGESQIGRPHAGLVAGDRGDDPGHAALLRSGHDLSSTGDTRRRGHRLLHRSDKPSRLS
jgi:MFS superfamily sulfate permease-like transporter